MLGPRSIASEQERACEWDTEQDLCYIRKSRLNMLSFQHFNLVFKLQRLRTRVAITFSFEIVECYFSFSSTGNIFFVDQYEKRTVCSVNRLNRSYLNSMFKFFVFFKKITTKKCASSKASQFRSSVRYSYDYKLWLDGPLWLNRKYRKSSSIEWLKCSSEERNNIYIISRVNSFWYFDADWKACERFANKCDNPHHFHKYNKRWKHKFSPQVFLKTDLC